MLGALALSTGIWVFGTDFIVFDIIIGIAELLAAGGAAYFFHRTAVMISCADGSDDVVLDVGGLRIAGRGDLACAALSFCVLLIGFSSFWIGTVSVGRFLAALAVLLCARHWGEAAGAAAGVMAGAAVGLSGQDYGLTVSSYALGGIAAGLFGHRAFGAGMFILIVTLSNLVAGDSEMYVIIIELFAAGVVFMLIPQSWVNRMTPGGVMGDTAGTLLRVKLAAISGTLKNISATTRQVSEKLSRLEGSGLSGVQERAIGKVCRLCGNKTSCWQFNSEEVEAAVTEAVKRLQKDGRLDRDNIPKYLGRSCCKLDALMSELNGGLRDHMAREGVQRKVSRVRGVMTDQFDGMAQMLDSISGELSSIRQMDTRKLSKIKDYLERENFGCLGVLGYHDGTGRIKIELTIPTYQLARLNKTKMALELSTILEADLDLPQVDAGEKEAGVRFCERSGLTADLGAYQIPNEKYKLCGDAYGFIRENGGQAHMILSDGMGSGGSAAVDSSMAANLLAQLLSVGVGHEAALKLVNSALLVKSGEESLATVDLCSIDLFTGRTAFYKAGAAPSFIIRGGRAVIVDSTSLPAGILRGAAFEKSSVTLKPGDTVVLVSDGAIATGTDWVISELEHLQNGGDIQNLCEKLAMTAKIRRQDGHSDDITVIAAAIN